MTTDADTKPAVSPKIGLLIGVLAVSTASTFIRLAQEDVASLALAAWRLTFASLILTAPAVATSRAEWRRLSRRDWWLMVLSGVFLALHFYTWITSLALTSVAASVVLVATNPLFVGLISHFFFNEPMTRQVFSGVLIAVVGSTVIGLGDAGEGTHHLVGDLLALVGAMAVAVYMLLGRRLRQRLSLLSYIFPVYATAALVLMALTLVTGTPVAGYPGAAWLWLILVAVIPQIVGHSSFNWALGHLSATYVALAALAEPIGSTILAWAILREPPTVVTILGGLLILAGIGLAVRPRRRSVEPSMNPMRRPPEN